MAAVAQLDQAQMQTAAEEYYNFFETFRALGAGGSVTVTDVFSSHDRNMTSNRHIGPYLQNTDPTTTAATGKTNFDLNI